MDGEINVVRMLRKRHATKVHTYFLIVFHPRFLKGNMFHNMSNKPGIMPSLYYNGL